MNILLISTYELGHQPFGLAEPAAWLRRDGHDVVCLDLALDPLDEEAVRGAGLVALYVPMHTATRLAVAAAARIRALHPEAHLCFYGLYGPANEEFLRAIGAGTILGGEFESGLVSLAGRLAEGRDGSQSEPVVSRERQRFLVPDRDGLPPLSRYAHLILPGGEKRTAGYVEASRGCKYLCRHCPVVPIYDGTFRVVQREVVLEDARRQAAAGARHITFGDPDFLNGPGHVMPIVEAMHRELPELTYDVTVKVEHLLRHADLLPGLESTGCLFVTTAVEAADDRILALLDKGHTRADFERVVETFDALDLGLVPTFVAFTPWISREGYVDLLEWLARLNLVDCVAPVQLALRLLIPPGSRLLELPEVRRMVGPVDREALMHPWVHPDPAMDRLAGEAMEIAERGEAEGFGRRAIFAQLWRAAHASAGGGAGEIPALDLGPPRPSPPRMSEAWYCCAEPTRQQITSI